MIGSHALLDFRILGVHSASNIGVTGKDKKRIWIFRVQDIRI